MSSKRKKDAGQSPENPAKECVRFVTYKAFHDESLSRQILNEQNPKALTVSRGKNEKRSKPSYNFNYGGSVSEPEKKILEIIDLSDLPLTPKEIASETGINHNSVKVYLRRLKERNFLIQPYRGYYSTPDDLVTFDTRPGGRVTSVVPRVHNVRLKIEGLVGGGLISRLDYGVAVVAVVVGDNGVANVQVDCYPNMSLDYTAFKLFMACLKRELSVPKNAPIYVTSFELNHDFAGIQIDGCKALTLSAFDGSFERLYNKHKNLLRSEVRAVGSTTPEAVYELLKGGVNTYNIMQGLALLINEIRQEREAQKFTNRILSDLLRKIGGRRQ